MCVYLRFMIVHIPEIIQGVCGRSRLLPISYYYQPCQHRLSQATTPLWTVGATGSVWHESTPAKEITRPSQTDRDYQTFTQPAVQNAPRCSCGLSLSLLTLDDCLESLAFITDCCQRLSCRRLRKFANSALMKGFEREHRNNRSHSHTGVNRISSKQSLTPHQLYPAMRRIYQCLSHCSCGEILFSATPYIGQWGIPCYC